MARLSKILAISVGAGMFIVALLSAWAYVSKDDIWEFNGSVRALKSLDAEVQQLSAMDAFGGLTASFISQEVENAKDEARKEGESVRSLTLPPKYRTDQLKAGRFSDSVASSSELISH